MKPIYKWILGLVFVLGGLYIYIKDIPQIKTDVIANEKRLTIIETSFKENICFIKESLKEMKEDVKTIKRRGG